VAVVGLVGKRARTGDGRYSELDQPRRQLQ